MSIKVQHVKEIVHLSLRDLVVTLTPAEALQLSYDLRKEATKAICNREEG